MAPRRETKKTAQYRKVRTGCEKCKQRRVKCDEQHPRCGNCAYLGHHCVYRQPQPSYPIFDAGPSDERGVVRFSALDLELIHHWTVSTADTIGGTEDLQRLLRGPLVSVAFQRPYLLHIGLAVASMHKAHLNPEQHSLYYGLGEYHYGISLPLYRANLPLIDSTNCHALYGCGQLIVKYLFASEPRPERLFFSPLEGSNAEAFVLLKGAYQMRTTFSHWLGQGEMACVATDLLDCGPSPRPGQQETCLASFFNDLTGSSVNEKYEDDGDGIEASRKAMQMLLHLFAKNADPSRKATTKALCVAWLAEVPTEFFARLRKYKPEALFVLAHYCILLHEINNSIWYMTGWSRALFEECVRHLDERWMPYFSWPLAVLQSSDTPVAKAMDLSLVLQGKPECG